MSTEISAQSSGLSRALQSRESVVLVNSLRQETRFAPAASARINPKTGRAQVARKLIRANMTKKGAGIIIHPKGLLVTNFHTIYGADKIGIILANGQQLGGTILHFDRELDLALIQVNPPSPLNAIDFADSNTVGLGDEIFHIGTSDFLNDTISGGKVSGLGTSQVPVKGQPKNVELIRVSINVYKGDSGGPLLNRHGELIGLVVAKNTKKERQTYAVPSNKIKKLLIDFTN